MERIDVDAQGSGLRLTMTVHGAEFGRWLLMARSRSIMVTGLYLAGAKKFHVAPGYTGHVLSRRWESKHEPKRMQVGASFIPGAAVAKFVGDKVDHRWVLYVCTAQKEARGAALVHTFTGDLTCAALASIVDTYYGRQKGGGGALDVFLDVAGTVGELTLGAFGH